MPNLPSFAEKATRVMRATQRACPYNNISNLFVRNGQWPNPRFGGDCLRQAQIFGDRLRCVIADPVRFHSNGEGTNGHIVPIVGDGDERMAFEITALATEPVLLEAIRGREAEKCIPTFPLPPAGSRELACVWMDRKEELNIRMLQGGKGAMLWHRISTDPPVELPDMPHCIDENMVLQPRRPLRMHVLEADFGKSTVNMDPADGAMTIQRVGAPVAWEKTRYFDDEVSRVAKVLGVTRAQFLEFFQEGWRMERELQGL